MITELREANDQNNARICRDHDRNDNIGKQLIGISSQIKRNENTQ